MRLGAFGVVVILLAVAGCAPGGGPSARPTQTLVSSTATPTLLPITAAPTLTSLPGPVDVATIAARGGSVPAPAQVMVGDVIEDLARSLGVSPDAIGVGEIEEVTWPDATLGCDSGAGASPDTAEVPGFRVILIYQGTTYAYHTDSQGRFVVCQAAESATGEPVILDPVVGSLVDLARRHLAEQLDLPLRRVFLADVSPFEWPDSSLGCQLSDQDYVATPVLGYRIVLRVGRQNYYYHSNFRQVILCPENAERLPAQRTSLGETETPVSSE